MNPSWIRRKIARKTNNSQLEFLIKEMQLHPDLTRSYPIQKCRRAKYEKLWFSLTDQLNELGPPHKNVPEWKRVWSDYKARLKTRVRKKCADAEVIDILRHLHPPDEDEFCIEDESDNENLTDLQIEHLEQTTENLKETSNCKTKNTENTTFSQMEVIIEELDKSPGNDFENEFENANGRQAHDAFWLNVTKKLNKMRSPVREVDEWKQVWANFKQCEKSKPKANELNVTVPTNNDIEEVTCNDSEPFFKSKPFATTDEKDGLGDPLHTPQTSNTVTNVTSFNFTESMEERFFRLLERQTAAIERQAVATEAILDLLKQQGNF